MGVVNLKAAKHTHTKAKKNKLKIRKYMSYILCYLEKREAGITKTKNKLKLLKIDF